TQRARAAEPLPAPGAGGRPADPGPDAPAAARGSPQPPAGGSAEELHQPAPRADRTGARSGFLTLDSAVPARKGMRVGNAPGHAGRAIRIPERKRPPGRMAVFVSRHPKASTRLQFLPHPVVDHALLMAQVVAVQAGAALQVGGVAQLALALGQDLAIGGGELELQFDHRRVVVAQDAYVVAVGAVPGLVAARALDIGDGHLHARALGQAL